MVSIEVDTESNILNTNAQKKPSIKTPSTKYPAIKTIPALTIKENNPNVNIVSGKLNKLKTGFKKVLSKPKTTEKTTAVPKSTK